VSPRRGAFVVRRLVPLVHPQKGVQMKMSSSGLLAALITTGVILASSGRAAAGPRAACPLLSLEEVRALVGAPVSVYLPDLSTPSTRADTTFATCTYVVVDAEGHLAKGRSAKFSLMWAPKAKLSETNDFYLKRHIEAPAIKGDVLVLAWVGDVSHGKGGDWAASQKLLAAVLQKL
jgi:hypothetical protein